MERTEPHSIPNYDGKSFIPPHSERVMGGNLFEIPGSEKKGILGRGVT